MESLTLGIVPSYAALCGTQAALVAVPVRIRMRRRLGLIGIGVPAAALALGVALLRGPAAGPRSLALLATVAAPVLASAYGWLAGWRRPGLSAVAAVLLYVLAWQASSLIGEAAGVVLIGLACLTLAAVVASIAPVRSIEAGLLLLALLDVILVWGTADVGPAATALDRAALPVLALPLLPDRQLPALQSATFGSASMGWLDLLAPALLGATLIRARQLPAAAATGLAGCIWGLLLTVTSTVAATVPVLAGLLVGRAGPAQDR